MGGDADGRDGWRTLLDAAGGGGDDDDSVSERASASGAPAAASAPEPARGLARPGNFF